jgi:hypothetical protein
MYSYRPFMHHLINLLCKLALGYVPRIFTSEVEKILTLRSNIARLCSRSPFMGCYIPSLEQTIIFICGCNERNFLEMGI